MRMKLDYTRCANVPTISALANELGHLAKEFADDADLTVVESANGFIPKLIYEGDDRYWIRNAGHAPAMWKRARGADCKMVALAFLEGHYPLITLRSSKITSVAELKGRRLALLQRKDDAFDLVLAQQLKIYATALASAGLTLDDVDMVRLPLDAGTPPDHSREYFVDAFHRRLSLLAAGTVDAFAFAAIPPEAIGLPQLNILYDARLDAAPGARANPSVLRGIVVSGPLLRERRDIVVRVLATLLRTGRWATQNPLEATRALARNLDKSPESLAASYENLAGGLRIDMSPCNVTILAEQKRFLVANKLIDADFDLNEWIDTDAIEEAETITLSGVG